MKSFLTLIFASSIALTSCKKETKVQNSATATNVIPFTEVGNQMNNEAIANQAQQPTNKVNSTNVMPTTTATIAGGKNPAHGQPSHRCDINVGEPLNSPPATTTPKPVVQQKQQQTQSVTVPTVVPAAPAVATTPTPEGMNPQHGQTNHRCDIAVGAPLPKS